jgi:hypothetical protein
VLTESFFEARVLVSTRSLAILGIPRANVGVSARRRCRMMSSEARVGTGRRRIDDRELVHSLPLKTCPRSPHHSDVDTRGGAGSSGS